MAKLLKEEAAPDAIVLGGPRDPRESSRPERLIARTAAGDPGPENNSAPDRTYRIAVKRAFVLTGML